MALSRKSKQYLTLTAKLLVVGGAFYFIYLRLTDDSALNWDAFTEILTRKKPVVLIVALLAFTFLNRFLEILKWQNLAGTIRATSLYQSTKEVLAAVTAALFTPNGIGEYAAKALYYKKQDTGNVIFLNLVCNGIQLLLAVAGGITGLIIFMVRYPVLSVHTLIYIVAGIVVVAVLLVSVRNFTIRGYSLAALFTKIVALPKKVHRKNIVLAVMRYAVLMHQYYFLFLAFEADLPYPILMATIMATYFLGSSLPTFQFLDFAVKGSVAVYFFGMLGVNEWIVVFVSTLIWLLNTVLPVSIGSYFVFTFKAAVPEAPQAE